MKYNQSKHTSIMHDEKEDIFFPKINLLYIDYGVSSEKWMPKTPSHNFWQLEFILEGTILAYFGKSKKMLSQKQILIIPPNTEHSFEYSKLRKTWSFKFNISPEFTDDLQVLILPDSINSAQILCDLLFQLLARYQQIPVSLYATFEHLLSGIIGMSYTKTESINKIPKWALIAKKFIAVNIGENINLEDLAKHLSYTRIYLAKLCKDSFNITLKEFFDYEKMIIVRRKLLYSNKSITNIAQETGFNNVHTFSRFYKRVTGLTPSEQRNSNK
jgi:AraC-like DNA-binding protein